MYFVRAGRHKSLSGEFQAYFIIATDAVPVNVIYLSLALSVTLMLPASTNNIRTYIIITVVYTKSSKLYTSCTLCLYKESVILSFVFASSKIDHNYIRGVDDASHLTTGNHRKRETQRVLYLLDTYGSLKEEAKR